MSPELLLRFERILFSWAGQWFPGSRRAELARALERAAAQAGWNGDLEGFLEHLERESLRPDEAPLREQVLGEVLVHETCFFRDPALWRALEEVTLPALIRAARPRRALRLWSAGCSTGEEPYSLALLLETLLTDRPVWDVHLLATDLSPAALARARAGLYRRRAFREMDLERWQTRFSERGGLVELDPEIRHGVLFHPLNLCGESFPEALTARMDLILCRNVLIYLEQETVSEVLTRLGRCLRPGGWLVLTPTELPLEPPAGLELAPLASRIVALRRSLPAQLPPPEARVPPDPPSTRPDPTRPLPGLEEIRQLADREEFVPALGRALELTGRAPERPGGWLLLAQIQEGLGRTEEARAALEAGLSRDPGSALAHLQLARLLFQGRGLADRSEAFTRSLDRFRELTRSLGSDTLLPDGDGMTLGEARALASQLERSWEARRP